METVIREARMEDAEALRRFAARLFAERLPGLYHRLDPTLEEEREFVGRYCESSNSTLLIAEADGCVVGLLGLLGRNLSQEVHVGSVGVSVDQDYRGRGIGMRLFEGLFEWAPEHGIHRIEIEAFANNPGAVRLYERVGFEREGMRRAAVLVDGSSVDVLLLAKLI